MYSDYGWVRIAAVSPEVRAAQPEANLNNILAGLGAAAEDEPDAMVFPELALTGCTCADLFHQTKLLKATEEALGNLLDATADKPTILAVGLPVPSNGQLFNCAAVLQAGKILGVVPKTIIPNYREFYEQRWFTSAAHAGSDTLRLCGRNVPFGTDLIFSSDSEPAFTFGVEICEDLWAPAPPSTRLALGGATILLNLSASHELVGKADYRRQLVLQQSGRCLTAYAYASAGPRESTTDLVYGGHCMVAENAVMLRESPRLQRQAHSVTADVDIQFLAHERLQNQAFNSQINGISENLRHISFNADRQPGTPGGLKRPLSPLPFVPGDPERRRQRCREILAIQSNALATRMENAAIEQLVLGLSGGLDSTLALLVAIESCSLLQLPADNIHCFTLPGFGTSKRTMNNVTELARTIGVDLTEINIRNVCKQHFQDLNHDGETEDAAFENIQARERTQILMNKANMLNALVVGTGDLSELALGWCTYGGDQISMYNVNSGVPKTLVSYLIRQEAENCAEENQALSRLLLEILETPISPELLPTDQEGEIKQQTEQVIGPYQLHDFFLYYLVRCGFPPRKVFILAQAAFAEEYEKDEIKKWLREFIRRFFSQQFKRSCLPDGPKVGTISLSPRSDWRMPSDSVPRTWLQELE